VEIGIGASYATLLGGDPNSALLWGGRNAWSLNPGVRIRVVRTPTTQLGLHVYGAFGAGARLDPSAVLVEIANEATEIAANANRQNCLASGDLSCTITSPSFNAQTAMQFSQANYGGGATLALAHAFTSTFGLQAALGLDGGYESTTAQVNSYGSVHVNFHVGVAPSLDFGPVSVMAEYMFTVLYDLSMATPSLSAPTILTLRNGFVLGVYYTGRDNLAIGALLNATIDEQTMTYPTDDMGSTPVGKQPYTRVAGQITARYFF
jgi:hypothetical protein